MADDLSKRGKADRIRINVTEQWELRYWADRFECTEVQLRHAVDEVGVMVKDVEAYFEAERNGPAKHGEQ